MSRLGRAPGKTPQPRLYRDLASWFHLLSHPREYAGEARTIRRLLKPGRERAKPSLLELGAGGGNNAWHLKKAFAPTLTDLSPTMLRESRRINPECRHIVGDMRTLRLGETFDAVLVHDAIMYMTTARDLARVMRTAYCHCRPGGLALFMPDFVCETFLPRASRGGNSDAERTLSYVETTAGARPGSRRVEAVMTIRLSDGRGSDRLVTDRHVFGLFPRATWFKLLRSQGFTVRRLVDPWHREIFLARRPRSRGLNSRRPAR